MFSSFFSASMPRFGFGKTASAGAIEIPHVDIQNIETSTDKRGRRLKHLLKLNHANFSILYNHDRFHNHTPHLLGSAFLLNATADQLTDIYEHAANHSSHEPWRDSPGEIALHDYRDFIGKREYQRAWVDFFEDQLVDHNYDWKMLATRFLFERGPKDQANSYPMISALTSGLGHPLIHLGYAYELNSREVAMEAMGLVATNYDPKLAALLEANVTPPDQKAAPAKTDAYSTSDLYELFEHIKADKRLDSHFTRLGDDNLSRLLSEDALTSILVEHFNAFKITSPKSTFEQTQRAATNLLIASSTADDIQGHGYDFFLVHLLTTSHALRILIPFFPAEYHLFVLHEWLLITLAIYIAQLRPTVKPEQVAQFDLKGRTWKNAEDLAINGKHKFDEHYVKAIRAMKEAAKVWGDKDNWFEKAAVRFATEFNDWDGFAMEGEQTHN